MKHNYLSNWANNRLTNTNSSLGYLSAPAPICNDRNMTPVWMHIFPRIPAWCYNLCWSTGHCRANRQDQQINPQIHRHRVEKREWISDRYLKNGFLVFRSSWNVSPQKKNTTLVLVDWWWERRQPPFTKPLSLDFFFYCVENRVIDTYCLTLASSFIQTPHHSLPVP